MCMSTIASVRVLEHTGSVAQHPRTSFKFRGCWLPTAPKTCLEEFAVSGLAGPDDDRRHGSESGCVEIEIPASRARDDYVVSVLILRKDLIHTGRWFEASSPVQHSLESGQFGEGGLQPLELGGRQVSVVNYGNRHVWENGPR